MELNLGTLSVDDSGRTSFSGLSSGVDFGATVDALIAVKRIPIDNLETRITDNDAKIAALTDLRGLMETLSGSFSALRGAVTFGGAGDVFKNKQVFATTSRTDGATPAAAGSLIGATVTNAAVAGSHEIEVRRVATAHKISSKAFTSQTADLNITGSFTITNGTTDTVTFQVQIFGDPLGGPDAVFAQILFEDIEQLGPGGGASATIGYQDGGGGFGDFQWSFDSAASVANGTVLSIVTPEPSTLILLALGGIAIRSSRRRAHS